MQEISLQAVPSQSVKAVLENQNFQIFLNQKDQGLFVDVNVGGVDVVLAVLAHDAVPLICRDYLGIAGNLIFTDTQGNNDPYYDGLGSRYVLVYLTASEYALI